MTRTTTEEQNDWKRTAEMIDGEYGSYPSNFSSDDLLDLLADFEDLKRENEWRPIETAPRDGRWILLYHSFKDIGGHIFAGYYGEHWEDDPAGGVMLEGWFQTGALMKPTHWQPLPAPPKVEKEN